MGGSRSDLRKSRVPGMIGRKEAVKNGVDCHSVNLIFWRCDMEQSKLYRCCNTCTYKDKSVYGCSKAGECYNGFSAYAPNAEIQKQEEHE